MAEVSPPTYVQLTDNVTLHCQLHDERFPKWGVCSKCIASPPPAIVEQAEPLPEPPEGCWSTIDVERELVLVAKSLAADIAAIKQGKPRRTKKRGAKRATKAPLDLHAYNTIAKLAAERIKALRAVADAAEKREYEAIQTRREHERLEIERGAGN